MERQVSTITPADTGTMMLPGAAAGALGFTAANIGKQLLANKFKGYGHLATSSLASAGFGALVGGLGGSFVKKKPRSTPIQTAYNNEMNNNNYIDKQAGIVSGVKGIARDLLGTDVKRYTRRADLINRVAERATGTDIYNFNRMARIGNAATRNANSLEEAVARMGKARRIAGTSAGISLGVGAGYALGSHKREKTANIEKQAGVASSVKGFFRDLKGTDVARYRRRAERAKDAEIHYLREQILTRHFQPHLKDKIMGLEDNFGRAHDIRRRYQEKAEEALKRTSRARNIARWGGVGTTGLGLSGAGYVLHKRNTLKPSEKTASQIYPDLTMEALEKQAGWTSFKQGLKMMKDSVLKDRSWRSLKGSAKFTGTQIKNDIGDVVQRYKPKFLKNTPSASEAANTAASTASTASTAPNKSFIQRHPVGTAVGALGAGYLAGHMLAPQPRNNQPEKVAGVGSILATYARKNPIETAFIGAGVAGSAANAYARRNGAPVEFSSEANPYSAKFESNLTQYLKHGISGDVLRLTGKFIKKEHPILGAISNNVGRGLRGLATIDATKGLYNAYKAVKYGPREKG